MQLTLVIIAPASRNLPSIQIEGIAYYKEQVIITVLIQCNCCILTTARNKSQMSWYLINKTQAKFKNDELGFQSKTEYTILADFGFLPHYLQCI